MMIEQGPAVALILLLWVYSATRARAALEAKPLHSTSWRIQPAPVRVCLAKRERYRVPGASPGVRV